MGMRKFRGNCTWCTGRVLTNNNMDLKRGLWRRNWPPDERSATTSACTSASAVSVVGSVCAYVACCSAACDVSLVISEDEADDELEEVAILVLAMDGVSHARKYTIGTFPALQSAAYDRSAN